MYKLYCTRCDLIFIKQFIGIVVIIINIILILKTVMLKQMYLSVKLQTYNIITFNEIHMVTCFMSQ